jgi:hypothetical protein
LISGCATLGKTGKTGYTGKWNYSVETPDGTVNGFMTINKDGKTYTGTVNTEDMTINLTVQEIEDGNLKTKLNVNIFMARYA